MGPEPIGVLGSQGGRASQAGPNDRRLISTRDRAGQRNCAVSLAVLRLGTLLLRTSSIDRLGAPCAEPVEDAAQRKRTGKVVNSLSVRENSVPLSCAAALVGTVPETFRLTSFLALLEQVWGPLGMMACGFSPTCCRPSATSCPRAPRAIKLQARIGVPSRFLPKNGLALAACPSG